MLNHNHSQLVKTNFLGAIFVPAMLLAFPGTSWAAPIFMGLGADTQVQDISGDGGVAVGFNYDSSTFRYQAWFWTEDQGLTNLVGSTSGPSIKSSRAHAVNTDGSVIVGQNDSLTNTEAFRWTQAGDMVRIGDLDGGNHTSAAFAVSNDGATMVGRGHALPSEGGPLAVRWTSSGASIAPIGDLPGGSLGSSNAFGISGDGSVAVGHAQSGSGQEAMKSVNGNIPIGLGDLPSGGFFSQANGISNDGSVIVGTGLSTSDTEAFRIVGNGPIQGLGTLGGAFAYSWANDASGDGSFVVGGSASINPSEAFVWDETNGIRGIRTILEGEGQDLTGWQLSDATGISDDGRFVVGTGKNPTGSTESWIAMIAGPNTSSSTDLTLSGGHSLLSGEGMIGQSASASGDLIEWSNENGGVFLDGGNWLNGSPPSASQTALFGLNTDYTVNFFSTPQTGDVAVEAGDVTFNGNRLDAKEVGVGSGGTPGTVTVTNSAKWTVGRGIRDPKGTLIDGNLKVGNGAEGLLKIDDLGTVEATSLSVGIGATDNGSISISGSGSSLTYQKQLNVGVQGMGSLDVQNGADLKDTVSPSTARIGLGAGSDGALTVTGSGSTWNTGSNIQVGVGGKGILNILDGALLDNTGPGGAASLTVGTVAGSNGDAFIDGDGSIVKLKRAIIGNKGDGEMTIRNKGRLEMELMRVGAENGGVGRLTISGAGSFLYGPGNGGGCTGLDGIRCRIEFAQFGAGDGSLKVGVLGTGLLTIENGGKVLNGISSIGSHIAGFTPSGIGSATVTGAGSTWLTGSLFVGSESDGELLVDKGGLMSSLSLSLGERGGTGRVTVADAGSALLTAGSVTIKPGSTLTVRNGARGTSDLFFVAGNATIEGDGTTWTASRRVSVGGGLGGQLTIDDGAVFTSLDVGNIANVGTGRVTIMGPGSHWDLGLNELRIGVRQRGNSGGGAGILRLENLARVTAGSILIGSAGRLEGNDSTVLANVINQSGFVSPGLSPGTLFIDGSFAQGPLGTTLLEIGLAADGSLVHDEIIFGGPASFEGTILLSFLNDLMFSSLENLTIDDFLLFDAGNIQPALDFLNVTFRGERNGVQFGLALTSNRSFEITNSVPEPATLTLFGLGLLGLGAARRRKRPAA